jgi:hypothetical protein
VRESLREIEWAIRDLLVEVAYAVDTDGEIVLVREGIHSMVDLSDVPIETLAGRILTHNHPQSTSLSWQDVRLALSVGLAEIWAVDTLYVYVLRPPEGVMWEDVADLVEVLRRQVERELVPAVNAGTLTPHEANLLYWRRFEAGTIGGRNGTNDDARWSGACDPTDQFDLRVLPSSSCR